MPFLPLYFQQLGVQDVGEIAMWSGLSLGVTPALTALMAPIWGRLADRYGRKVMVERALVSFVIVMTALAYVTHAGPPMRSATSRPRSGSGRRSARLPAARWPSWSACGAPSS
jgi:MFS family permease